MGALAEAYVAVRPDTRDFGKELKRGLRRVDAEKAGKESGRKFGNAFGGTVKGILGGAAILGALAGAIGFLKDANAEARESIKVGKTTEQIIKDTGGAAKISAGQVGALATAISNKTGMDDEAIQSGANLLLTFKNVRNEVGKGSNVFDRATAAAVDLSAAGFGSVSSTSKILGKALNDPINGITALSRAGVTFSDKQKTTIKRMVETGDVLGAQKIIMQEVESQVGDVAEAQATWADKAKVAWGNVKETVGGFLTGALEPVSKWFVNIGLPAVQDFFKKISQDKALKTAIVDLRTALAGFTDKDFKAALTDIAAALPPIVTGLGQVVSKYTEIADAIDKFENASFGEGDKVGGPVGQIIKDFGAGGTIEQALIQFRGFVGRHVRQGWADAKASFVENHGAILAEVQRFVGGVIDWFAQLPGGVMAWVRKTFAEAKASFVRNHAQILAGVGQFLARMVGFFQARLADIKARWGRFWGDVRGTASDAMNKVRTGIATALGQVRDGFSRGVDAIGRAWGRLLNVAKAPVRFVVNTVLDNGLLGAFRAISNLVGFSAGKNFHVSLPSGFAGGGVLPGYTPGRDVHRFVSATGGVLDLSGGEGIARPEIVRAVGRRRWDAANAAARQGRVGQGLRYLGGFASGGVAAAERLGRSMGIGTIGTYPGHHPSMALARDFMTSSASLHERLSSALWANRQALNLWYIISRRRIISMTRPGAGWQPYTRSNPHTDHVHASFYPAALRGVVGALTKAGSIAGAAFAPAVDLGKYMSQIGGAMGRLKEIGDTPFGQMVAGIPKKVVGAVKAKISSLAASFMPSLPGTPGLGDAGNLTGSNRQIGRQMMLAAGFGAQHWPALERLWTGESNWNHRARNPSSGAYGIPQSLPASKMRSAGADYLSNPRTQIAWGLGYIRDRYGTPTGALNFWNSKSPHWYDSGGYLPTGLSLAMNNTGRPERVVPHGGERPIVITIDLGDGVTQRVQGVLDEHDEFRASVGRMR